MKYRIATQQQVDRLVDRLREYVEKTALLVTVEEFKKPKTHSQNAKLHAMIDELADHVGYTAPELKAYLKEECGPHRVVAIAGDERWIPKSVAEYTAEEMSVMIERVHQIAAESGCVLE